MNKKACRWWYFIVVGVGIGYYTLWRSIETDSSTGSNILFLLAAAFCIGIGFWTWGREGSRLPEGSVASTSETCGLRGSDAVGARWKWILAWILVLPPGPAMWYWVDGEGRGFPGLGEMVFLATVLWLGVVAVTALVFVLSRRVSRARKLAGVGAIVAVLAAIALARPLAGWLTDEQTCRWRIDSAVRADAENTRLLHLDELTDAAPGDWAEYDLRIPGGRGEELGAMRFTVEKVGDETVTVSVRRGALGSLVQANPSASHCFSRRDAPTVEAFMALAGLPPGKLDRVDFVIPDEQCRSRGTHFGNQLRFADSRYLAFYKDGNEFELCVSRQVEVFGVVGFYTGWPGESRELNYLRGGTGSASPTPR